MNFDKHLNIFDKLQICRYEDIAPLLSQLEITITNLILETQTTLQADRNQRRAQLRRPSIVDIMAPTANSLATLHNMPQGMFFQRSALCSRSNTKAYKS